MSHVNPSS